MLISGVQQSDSVTHTHTHTQFFFIIGYYNVLNIVPCIFTVFPGGPVVKNTPAKQEPQETQVRSLSQEDPLEEGMATHSSILAWRIPWPEEPGGPQSMGLQRAGQDLVTKPPPYVHFIYSSVYVNPNLLIYPSPSTFPFGSHKFDFYAHESNSVL